MPLFDFVLMIHNSLMSWLGTIISFENLEWTQIYCWQINNFQIWIEIQFHHCF